MAKLHTVFFVVISLIALIDGNGFLKPFQEKCEVECVEGPNKIYSVPLYCSFIFGEPKCKNQNGTNSDKNPFDELKKLSGTVENILLEVRNISQNNKLGPNIPDPPETSANKDKNETDQFSAFLKS